MKHLITTIVIFLLAGGIASAQRTNETPGMISYQGLVSSHDGAPLADGEYRVTVTLYADAGGTVRVWQDTYATPVHGGVFNIYLGSGKIPLPAPSLMDRALWIGTRIAGGEEMRPLTRLSASPYAINVPDNAITTSKLADGAVTADKMSLDYISGVSVNGRKIDVKGTMLNIQAGKDIDVSYDDTTQSLVIGSAAISDERKNPKSRDKGRELLGGPNDSWGMEGDGAGGVAPDANDWIGTSTTPPNIQFTIKVNGERVMYYQPNGTATPSIIGGHQSNTSTPGGDGNIIAGGGTPGFPNTIEGRFNVIAGGAGNTILNTGVVFGVIGGGQSNVIGSSLTLAHYATIAGGFQNRITGLHATIGGGRENSITSIYGTVAGGIGNIVSGSISSIAGGDGNQIGALDGAIGGGYHNQIVSGADYGAIAGGREHRIIGSYGFVGGGQANSISAAWGVVSGGFTNQIFAPYGAIAGGGNNSVVNAGSLFGTIGGGERNQIGTVAIPADHTTIAGGYLNQITAPYSTIGGGSGNGISGEVSTIAGGGGNLIRSADGAIGGGNGNLITSAGLAAAIPGGDNLTAQSYGQTVVGVRNIPEGAMIPSGTPNDDPIFIVGNGIQGFQSNAFEVSYNGHSTVYHNTGGATPVILGSTYTDNVVYAWGNIDQDGNPICAFGVSRVDHLGDGWYQIVMDLIDQYGAPIALNCGSVTATISSSQKPGQGWVDVCRHIGVSQIENSVFDVYISDRDCKQVNEFFTFKVTGRP